MTRQKRRTSDDVLANEKTTGNTIWRSRAPRVDQRVAESIRYRLLLGSFRLGSRILLASAAGFLAFWPFFTLAGSSRFGGFRQLLLFLDGWLGSGFRLWRGIGSKAGAADRPNTVAIRALVSLFMATSVQNSEAIKRVSVWGQHRVLCAVLLKPDYAADSPLVCEACVPDVTTCTRGQHKGEACAAKSAVATLAWP